MGGGSDPDSVTVRATVVQASTVFYNTPATLGSLSLTLIYFFDFFSLELINFGFPGFLFSRVFLGSCGCK